MERHEYQAFQEAMKTVVLSGSVRDGLAEQLKETGGVPAVDRLQVHHNNFRETLSDSLAGIFPVLEAFVGSVFVKGALSEFCLSHPPTNAALSGYGAGFANFLDTHKASEQLPYVADIVRLEWAIHELQLVQERENDIERDADTYRLSPNARVIESLFPLMSLWSVAGGHIPPESVHLAQGGQTVVALLKAGEISLVTLDAPEAAIVSHLRCTPEAVSGKNSTLDSAAIDRLAARYILVPA